MGEFHDDIEYVYKYRTFSRNHLQAMFENKIWFSVSSEFNDPFDSSEYLLTQGVSVEKLIKLMDMSDPNNLGQYSEILKRDGQVFINYIYNLFEDGSLDKYLEEPLENAISNLRRAYIFSTCKRWDNNVMWSHYGDYHKGFCVRYNVKKLKECDVALRAHRFVNYSNSTIDPLDFFIDPRFEKFPFAAMDEAIFRKSKDYELENEYRFVLDQLQKSPCEKGNNFKSNSIPIEHPESAVDRVYFGCKANDFDKMQLQSLLDNREIEYFDLKPAGDSTFNLLEIPYNP